MSFIDSTITAASTFTCSYSLIGLNAAENAAERGSTQILVTLLQFSQSAVLSKQFDLLWQKTHAQRALPNYICYSMLLINPILQFGEWSFNNNDYVKNSVPNIIKNSIICINKNAGNLSLVASTVTGIALLVLGQHIVAATILTNIAFCFLEKNQIMPGVVCKVYWLVGPWISAIGACFTSIIFIKVFSIIQISHDIAKLVALFFHNSKPDSQIEHSSKLKELGTFNQIMEHRLPLKWNRKHVFIEPFPIFPSIDYNELLRFNENFLWDSPSTFEQLKEDARWETSDQYKAAQGKSDEERKQLAIEYARKQFSTLILGVINENIESGSDINYECLKNYLRCVSKLLPLANEELQRQIMLQLALEGGDRCSTGVYYQLEIASVMLLLNTSQNRNLEQRRSLPLKQKILILLQQERLRVAQGLYRIMVEKGPALPFMFGGAGTVHAMNKFTNIFESTFGLPEHGSSKDLTVKTEWWESLSYRFLLNIYPEDFWQKKRYELRDGTIEEFTGYTMEMAVEKLQSCLGTPLLSKPDIFEWAANWVNQIPISESEKEAFLEKLADGSFEQPSFDQINSTLKNQFLQAMLFDMDILQAAP